MRLGTGGVAIDGSLVVSSSLCHQSLPAACEASRLEIGVLDKSMAYWSGREAVKSRVRTPGRLE
jgi:hypothetical protein